MVVVAQSRALFELSCCVVEVEGDYFRGPWPQQLLITVWSCCSCKSSEISTFTYTSIHTFTQAQTVNSFATPASLKHLPLPPQAPAVSLQIAAALPHNNYSDNAFRNSFFYQVGLKLFVFVVSNSAGLLAPVLGRALNFTLGGCLRYRPTRPCQGRERVRFPFHCSTNSMCR